MAHKQHVVVYAQSLDNSGAVEAFAYRPASGAFEDLSAKPRDRQFLQLLDELLAGPVLWQSRRADSKFYANTQGDCVLMVQPLELDASGRVAPILLVFNAWSPSRHMLVAVTEKLHHVMHRHFDARTHADVLRMHHLLQQPVWAVRLRLWWMRLWSRR